MRIRCYLLCICSLSLSSIAIADVAKHTTVNTNAAGVVTEYTEMVADDSGNLRIEIYGVDASGNRGALRDFVIFQANEQKMLTSSGGTCQSMSFDGEELPGGISKEDVMAAQSQMQQALEEMRAQNPEMAKMLESQMGDMGTMMGGGESGIQLAETGQTRKIDGYDTKSFRVSGLPGPVSGYTLWAANIDDVKGGRTIGNASQKMMQASKQMMENMGMGQAFGANLFGEIMEKMSNYYPIMTDTGDVQTRLTSTDGGGSTDFYPACN